MRTLGRPTLFLLSALWLGACAPPDARALAPKAFQARLAEPGVQLVDVRQPEENAAGRIHGATLIPLGELSGSLARLDKSRPVLLYCRSGRRSAKALALLQDAGFSQLAHLDGGLSAWSAAGLPVEAP